MVNRHLFLITRQYGTRDGGNRFVELLLSHAALKSIPVTMICSAEVNTLQVPVNFVRVPALFQRSPYAVIAKLSAWVKIVTALLRVGRSGARPFVIVQGDLPRLSYLVVQLLVPTIFLRQDLVLTCPANDRFLPVSCRICSRPVGLGCLRVNMSEGCLQTLSPIRRLGRIALRMRDGLLYRGFSRFLCVSAYSSALHLGQPRHFVYPYQCDSIVPSRKMQAARYRLLFIGRLEAVKGPEDALRVLAELPDIYSLDVAGAGSKEEELRVLASDLGILHRITFHGWIGQSAQAALLERSGLLLFPSRWAEAFGLVGVEAMAAGVPVVAYDVGGVAEWCRGDGGRMVPCGRVDLMRAEVVALTESIDYWQTASAAARQTVAQRFSRERHVSQLRAHLPELLGED